MATTLKDKILRELEKASADFNYEFIIHQTEPNKGKVFLMNRFTTELSFTYVFTQRHFSITFYEKGQEPIWGKPLLELSLEQISFLDNKTMENLIHNVHTYLERLQRGKLAG